MSDKVVYMRLAELFTRPFPLSSTGNLTTSECTCTCMLGKRCD